MLSTQIDNTETVFTRMSDINIEKIPLNPLDLIMANRWQVSTYQIFSQIFGMTADEMKAQISPSAFSFYSHSNNSFCIIYNSELSQDLIYFNLAHEIGHILYRHISPEIPMYIKGMNKLERDILADQFARFVLGIK